MTDNIDLQDLTIMRSTCLKDELYNHKFGKLTARERIKMLFGKEKFTELYSYVESSTETKSLVEEKKLGDGVITGYGKINGVNVFAVIQDFSFLGGSLGKRHAEKIVYTQRLALKAKAPIIFINDSGGARIQEGIDSLAGYGDIFFNNVKSSGKIMQICLILGPCAGGAVYSPALMDFIIMADSVSKMFITGPAVVKEVTGNNYTVDELGGTEIHCVKSGVVHFHCKTEYEVFEKVKQLICFFNLDIAKQGRNNHNSTYKTNIDSVVPANKSKPYDAHDLIRCLAEDFIEYQADFAKNVVVGFGFISGYKVGIVASNPKIMAGCLDIDSSDKIARFVNTCNCFSIPIITLQDVPGFFPEKQEEERGIERHGAKIIYAYTKATVPKITIIVRKAFGGAYIALASKHLGADFVFAWPSAEIAVMGAEAAVNIIYKKVILESVDPILTRNEKVREYNELFMNPYIAAKRGYIDDVIFPTETRDRIVSSLELLNSKYCVNKSDNYPV